MKREYKFSSLRGGKCLIILEDEKITIKRKGILAFFNYGLKGEKVIFLKNISGIQLKEARLTIGYMQFVIMGSQESKAGLQAAMKDENTVLFGDGFHDKKMNQNAKEIKEHIERYNSNANCNSNNMFDKYDKLEKIKRLLDNGVITKEEFEQEKKKLLQ